MRFMSWPQAIVLGIGLLLVLLTLLIPYSSYNIFYAHETATGGVTVYTVTCPAPVDQPSCDEFAGPVKAAICEDCNQIASSEMTWFWILFSLTIVGTIAGYFITGYLQAQKE